MLVWPKIVAKPDDGAEFVFSLVCLNLFQMLIRLWEAICDCCDQSSYLGVDGGAQESVSTVFRLFSGM